LVLEVVKQFQIALSPTKIWPTEFTNLLKAEIIQNTWQNRKKKETKNLKKLKLLLNKLLNKLPRSKQPNQKLLKLLLKKKLLLPQVKM